MPEKLSIKEARKLVLNSQQVFSPSRTGAAIDATYAAIKHLGYIQIDTISVVARAHHHTLWNRNPRYKSIQLDQLLEQRKVFEYWSHAAAYLPIDDFRFSLPRMQTEQGDRGNWLRCEPKIKTEVFQRIRDEGPLMARDFVDPRPGRNGMWDWKPAKHALEQLFMEGVLMTTRRQGFNKVYDLTERVLPPNVVTVVPTPAELARHLINSFLRANGLGLTTEISYLRKGIRPVIQKVSMQMIENGELLEVDVRGQTWLALPQLQEVLSKPLSRSKLKILSPFDNLVIQRKRMRQLFEYDFLIECYVPAPKRKYGYFCLPLVWQGEIIGRMDCKAHRDVGKLEIRGLFLESGKFDLKQLLDALVKELRLFSDFNGCHQIQVSSLADASLQKLLCDQLDR